jgi:DNA-binding MarR family transcriptional regulator/N-acetylglutamate synthase-like GNAT family acetyltransferase
MVPAIRRFNRFYTAQLGILNRGYLDSKFSLAEARVLYELANREHTTASELAKDLGLDPGYLSRILRNFQNLGYVRKKASTADARQAHLSLTKAGHRVYDPLERKSHDEIASALERLSAADQQSLVDAMRNIQRILAGSQSQETSYTLRSHRPGDMGWVTHRHGVLYANEYGFDERFEAMAADIAARFVQNLDPKRERCWIAEKDGAIAGSVFLVKETAKIARLRLLLVEPWARGLGIGHRLVAECSDFARQAGYRKITLMTLSVLHAARKIYAAAGYRLAHQETKQLFGTEVVDETWDLQL